MSPARYSITAIVLHWAIAFLLVFQLSLGWHMMSMGQGATTYAAFQFHKSIGITILALSLLRVVVRFVKPRPREVETGAVGLLVRLVHFALYAFMIGGPLTGWAVVSTAPIAIPTKLYSVIPLPHLPIGHQFNGLLESGHEVIAWIGAGLILVHIAGALRHHLAGGHENVIGRMVPGVTANRAIRAGLTAIAVLGGAAVLPWLVYPSAVQPLPTTTTDATEDATSDATDGPAVSAPDAGVSEPAAEETAAPSEAAADQAAGPVRWSVQPGGRLGFTASMNGDAIEGRFEKWSADIVFDPQALADSTITVRVPLLSANTDNADRDGMLKGADFFGSAGTATFRSTRISSAGGEQYTAAGTLTMNGISRPTTLSFSLHIAGDRASVTGSAKLDRTAFKIGTGQWASTDQIAGNVDVKFKFAATKKP